MKSGDDGLRRVEGTWSIWVFLHVLWVVLQTAYELCDWMALVADLIDRVEQWKPGQRRRRRYCSVSQYPKIILAEAFSVISCMMCLDLLVNEVFVLEDEINLSCCCWSLQLLPIQHLLLQFLYGLRKERSKRRNMT